MRAWLKAESCIVSRGPTIKWLVRPRVWRGCIWECMWAFTCGQCASDFLLGLSRFRLTIMLHFWVRFRGGVDCESFRYLSPLGKADGVSKYSGLDPVSSEIYLDKWWFVQALSRDFCNTYTMLMQKYGRIVGTFGYLLTIAKQFARPSWVQREDLSFILGFGMIVTTKHQGYLSTFLRLSLRLIDERLCLVHSWG